MKERITLTLDKELLNWLDAKVDDKVFANRSHGFEFLIKRKMMEERELGPIYGYQWRNFGAKYVSHNQPPQGQGVDQLKRVVEMLKKDPSDRRMIVSAWNPVDFHRMALPPCHYSFQVTVINNKLNLLWNQRSIDSALGLPFNIPVMGCSFIFWPRNLAFKKVL